MASIGPARWPADQQIRDLLERSAGGPALHEVPLVDARARVSAIRAMLPPVPMVHSVRDSVIPGLDAGVPIRTYLPTTTAPAGAILYFHGGGWTLGGIDDSDSYCRHLAVTSGCQVISVGYRLAPEHPYPASLNDARAALDWYFTSHPGESAVLAGDSAGGNLATVCAMYAHEHQLPVIGQVLIYPVVDTDDSRESFIDFGGPGLLMTAADMHWFWDNYVPDTGLRSLTDISPLHTGDFTGMAPALLLVAEHDVLRDGALAYAKRLSADDVDVQVLRYLNMIHGFVPLIGMVDDADDALERVAAYCRSVLSSVH